MTSIRCENLGVMLRLHKREQYLRDIVKQIKHLGRHRKVTLVLCFDRPSQAVVRTVDRLDFPEHWEIVTTEAPAPVVSTHGERWSEVLQHCFLEIRDRGCDAGMLWDDDLLYTPRALKEIRYHLEYLAYDRIDALWYHVWDSEDQHNDAFPPHWAAALFRIYPSDSFSSRFVAHCPERTALSERSEVLEFPALHYGYFQPADRDASWLAAKRSGKLDGHTLALVRKPKLRDVKPEEPCIRRGN